jgi:RNA polymerase sigma factor (sigma-70 family)
VGAVLNDAEESDWRQLAEEATPWLLSQVREQAGDSADIENIVTESLVRLYAHWDKVPPEKRRSWLTAVARNLAIDDWRRNKRWRIIERGLKPRPLPPADEIAVARTLVPQLLAQLSEPQRRAVSLRYLQELPIGEVAHQMGVQETVAANLIENGMRRLRKLQARGSRGSR